MSATSGSPAQDNPLLALSALVDFGRFEPEQVEPALDQILADYRQLVAALLRIEHPDYQNFILPLETASDRLHRMWASVSHLNSVCDSEPLRAAYDLALPKLTEFSTELGQNPQLLGGYQKIRDASSFSNLSTARKRVVDNAIRDFQLAGVNLADNEKQRVAEINQRLAECSNKFSKNVLDATLAWSLDVEDDARLAGLPESELAAARQTAEAAGVAGYRFSLQAPSFIAVMTYVEDRDLRRQMYEAFVTRASDQGPNGGQFDNGDVMADILELRAELAQLLGFDTYAEYSLATKMARTPDEVTKFLTELSERSRPSAEQDFAELTQFARDDVGIDELEAWDLTFVSERFRKLRFDFDQQQVRPYFPIDRVLTGLFEVTARLFDVKVEERPAPSKWHDDVRYFEIKDSDGGHRGAFYIDLYARANKRGGAWLSPAVTRFVTRDSVQTPIAFVTCNFSPAVDGQSALLRHEEVTTLFHEFGHGLHHMLTRVDCAAVSGISGVEWDAVELPSQFLENWCWSSQSLRLISGHFETGDVLPDELLERMQRARNFQSGLQMLRQIEFALFDMRLHSHRGGIEPGFVQQTLDRIRDQIAVIPAPEFNRFQNGFSHIFAGGYAAGYYSYKWAEVLSADAFGLFEEKGIFDKETGRAFRERILEKGGSEDALDLFVDFRGREPSVEALLRQSGL